MKGVTKPLRSGAAAPGRSRLRRRSEAAPWWSRLRLVHYVKKVGGFTLSDHEVDENTLTDEEQGIYDGYHDIVDDDKAAENEDYAKGVDDIREGLDISLNDPLRYER